ncbi:MAG: hypothetical protein AMJ60_04380 [Desulfobacterales bacterium SG8_35]|nr:MAG: hypothetical protein AMJ60_04380 [Desulfobacterales bacterium SG8_35]
MKKVLATVAALGLVFGVAANALALDQPARASESEADTAPRVPKPTAPGVALWSVAGHWVLAGAYLQDGLGRPGGADVQDLSDSNDAFYIYSFKILPVLQVNDKIAVKAEIRFDDRTVFGGEQSKDAGARDADFKHLYMEWTSPWGKTRFGRTPAGAWAGEFMNSTGQGDRLMWWPNMLPENWGMLLFTQKITENDAGDIAQADGDVDGYYVDLSYKADFGKTIVALWTVRNAMAEVADEALTTTQFRLYGNYNFDALNIEYELNWDFGDGPSEIGGAKSDRNAIGFELDASYKMQDWTMGGLFFYMSGDDDPNDNDSKAMFAKSNGVGKDYNPYQIMTGDYMNLLNGDNPLSPGCNDVFFTQGSSGVWSLGGYVKYAMSPELSLGGEIGYFAATDEPDGWDDEMGWEFGVGMGYKIMDNLTYNAHFSYLSTGDFFKAGGDTGNDDVYLLAHALSMKF